MEEDPKAPVLLHAEGRYSIRGSVFSIVMTIWSSKGRARTRSVPKRCGRNAILREGPGNGDHECVVMWCKERVRGKDGRGEDQTEVVVIATVLTPVWNDARENDAGREEIRPVAC